MDVSHAIEVRIRTSCSNLSPHNLNEKYLLLRTIYRREIIIVDNWFSMSRPIRNGLTFALYVSVIKRYLSVQPVKGHLLSFVLFVRSFVYSFFFLEEMPIN